MQQELAERIRAEQALRENPGQLVTNHVHPLGDAAHELTIRTDDSTRVQPSLAPRQICLPAGLTCTMHPPASVIQTPTGKISMISRKRTFGLVYMLVGLFMLLAFSQGTQPGQLSTLGLNSTASATAIKLPDLVFPVLPSVWILSAVVIANGDGADWGASAAEKFEKIQSRQSVQPIAALVTRFPA